MWSRAALLLLCLLSSGPVAEVSGLTFNNVKTLTTDLFADYNKYLRPFSVATTPTQVNIGFWLSSIVELDEVEQKLVFSSLLYVNWQDPSLEWTMSSYNGTDYFSYQQDQIWIPDLTVINSVETMEELGFNRNYMYVKYDGTVQWMPVGVFSVSCEIDVTFYPFDTQSCDVVFSTLVSNEHEIQLNSDPSHAVDLRLYNPSGTWELVDITVQHSVDSSSKTRETFSIKIKRLHTYYVLSMIIPVMFLAVCATLVFALPADSGEKMGTAITVLLAFAVYLTLLSDQMPQTSLNISVLAVYLNLVLGQTAMGVILSVWVINLHYRDDQQEAISPHMRTIVNRLKNFRFGCKRNKNSVKTIIPAREGREGREGANGAAPSSTAYSPPPGYSTPNFGMPLGPQLPGIVPEAGSRPDDGGGVRQKVKGQGQDSDPLTWKEVSVTIDRFLFRASSVFLLASTVLFMMILVIGGALTS